MAHSPGKPRPIARMGGAPLARSAASMAWLAAAKAGDAVGLRSSAARGADAGCGEDGRDALALLIDSWREKPLDLEAVRAAIECGCPLDARDPQGRSPAMLAARSRRSCQAALGEAVRMLGGAGADMGLRDPMGEDAMGMAIMGGNMHVLRAVLACGRFSPGRLWRGALRAVRAARSDAVEALGALEEAGLSLRRPPKGERPLSMALKKDAAKGLAAHVRSKEKTAGEALALSKAAKAPCEADPDGASDQGCLSPAPAKRRPGL